MVLKKWVKNIQTAGYNGARTVLGMEKGLIMFAQKNWIPAIVNTGRGKTNDFGAKTRKNLHIIVFTPTSN